MLAVVVVTYSAAVSVVERCVASVHDEADLVVVVDTGRRSFVLDGTEVVRVPNHGFGAAADAGLRRALAAGADAVLVLNDDTVARPGWRAALEAELAPGVGAVQPVLVEPSATGDRIASLGVRIGPDGAGVDLGDGEPDRPSSRGTARDLDVFTGGAVLLTAELVEATGGFDRQWFLYYEDVDLARRARALGFRIRLAPGATVVHTRGTSTSADPDRTRFLQERNRLWSAFRHADAPTVVRALWLSIRRLRHRPRRVHARALAAGLGGAPRQLARRLRRVERTGPPIGR